MASKDDTDNATAIDLKSFYGSAFDRHHSQTKGGGAYAKTQAMNIIALEATRGTSSPKTNSMASSVSQILSTAMPRTSKAPRTHGPRPCRHCLGRPQATSRAPPLPQACMRGSHPPLSRVGTNALQPYRYPAAECRGFWKEREMGEGRRCGWLPF